MNTIEIYCIAHQGEDGKALYSADITSEKRPVPGAVAEAMTWDHVLRVACTAAKEHSPCKVVEVITLY